MNVRDIWVQRSAFVSVMLAAGASLPADEPSVHGGSFEERALDVRSSSGDSQLVVPGAVLPVRSAGGCDAGGADPMSGAGFGAGLPRWRLNVQHERFDFEAVGASYRF